MIVRDSTCPQLAGSVVSLSGNCVSTFSTDDGGVTGRVIWLDDFTFLADLSLGACSVIQLPGADGGYAFSCPQCEFRLR